MFHTRYNVNNIFFIGLLQKKIEGKSCFIAQFQFITNSIHIQRNTDF